MLKELSDIRARLRVRWHSLLVAVGSALPVLLLHLDGVDFRPILQHIIPADYVDLVVAMLPFVLAVMHPMVHMEEPKDA